jgi:hypothetical protein
VEDIICPICNSTIKADDNWDFIDEESHIVICDCGKCLNVTIERPIQYHVEVL